MFPILSILTSLPESVASTKTSSFSNIVCKPPVIVKISFFKNALSYGREISFFLKSNITIELAPSTLDFVKLSKRVP